MHIEQLRIFAAKAKHILRHPLGRIEWFVGIVGLVFGLIFLVVIPPMQGSDESNQFLRAYQISEGNIISDYVGPSTGVSLQNCIATVLAWVVIYLVAWLILPMRDLVICRNISKTK